MCREHQGPGPRPGFNRRTFLSATALAGAATAVAAAPAQAAAERWATDPDSPRFTVAVMPDTQYLFDGPSLQAAPVEASLRYLLQRGRDENIVFLSHLGDLTQNGRPEEFAAIGKAFELLDDRRVGYSVLAGNHDIDSGTDDQRGDSAYLDAFGPDRFGSSPTFRGATADGYNTYHVFRAAGREWLVLALDWRPSAGAYDWAKKVLAEHPRTPVILTTHQLVEGDSELSGHGQELWDRLIESHDQIFLTLNGHDWPAARTVRKNSAGREVHLHLTNYQNRYYGGSAMIRLYHFDLARGTIDVETFSPWLLSKAADDLNELEREEIELTGPDDRFSLAIDFEQRFSGFAPVPPRPARPASALLVPGTVAYWRFDSGEDGSALPDAARVRDLSGHGNDLTAVRVPGSPSGALTWSDAHHPDQPGHGSLRLDGGKPPLRGGYLRTADDAPLNGATFPRGYTIEAFFRLPADWDASRDAWSGILGRAGAAEGSDEPPATLSLSNNREAQWAVFPPAGGDAITNWGHETPLGQWQHVAVVNDGRHTTMYIEGCPVVRNPAAVSTGLATRGLPWLLGGYEYAGVLDQLLNAWVGDVRVVDHALAVREFMNA
ncbi:LamG-like jellyroll fold domain-containing protein [Streptomyces sp. NPDC002896]|uniref:LamG-like jellyroll fold domain-containing protein n=1 Tax=Streptomyces sp. NPDC002896 TaxID=3154438 RepID=UPI00331BE088